MKSITNIFAGIAVVAMVFPVINSCKKGSEDPFISMRSRNKRVEGTWTLKTVDYSYTEVEIVSGVNTVNSDNYTKTDNTTYTVKYDGANMVTSKNISSDTKDNKKSYSFTNSIWADDNDNTVTNSSEVRTKSYLITVSIYKDNTYEYTVTEKAAGYSYNSSTTFNAGTPITSTISCSGDQIGGTCYTTDENTTTLYGTWTWEDELGKSSKGKIVINAGPLSGYLVRLSNKELIIDYTYQGLFGSGNFFNSSSYGDDSKKDNSVNTSVSDTLNLPTHNNSNANETTKGTRRTTTTTTVTIVAGKSTWEKTDKKRKRKDDGEE